jgi:ligand-binding SRPBCC domain-containing protein
MPRAIVETRLAASPQAVFEFHERPDAIRLLTPWWSGARVVRPARSLRPGERALVLLGWGPFAREWLAEHNVYEPPHRFEDVQVRGPFRRWRHTHRVLTDTRGSRLRDELDYELPGGPLAPLVDRLLIRPFLRRLFLHRHTVTRRWVERGPFETEPVEARPSR